jgi:hypothetical protein
MTNYLETEEATVFVHAVYFWLKRDMTSDETEAFEKGMRSLSAIHGVRHCFTGRPADTDRPIIDRTYDYALVVVFADRTDHDAYQNDKIHDAFRDNFGRFFLKVQIYDSE